MDLFSAFAQRCDPNAPAIMRRDAPTWAFGDLFALSARLANALRALSVNPRDRVVVQVRKSVESLALYLACLRSGAIFVPLNFAYTPSEVRYFLGDSAPVLFVCASDRRQELAAVAQEAGVWHVATLDAESGSLIELASDQSSQFADIPIGPDDVAAILYTSGTTGRSKGAMLTQDNLVSNALTLHTYWGFNSQDVLLHVLPLFHTHGLFVAVSCALLNGTPMQFLSEFSVDQIIEAIPRCSVFMGVPTHYTRLLGDPRLTAELTRSMRLFISGSAPLSGETHAKFEARTGHRILERYGMTETTMLTSNPLHGERRPGTVGKALPGVELRIIDRETQAPADFTVAGGIEVRGPNVFKAYWQAPEKTLEAFRKDGFFITGDVGAMDSDGYVTILTREKDLIISGGLNVYPAEVEGVLNTLQDIADSAVVGVPHPDFGEAVVAAIVLRPDHGSVREEDVIAACRASLAAFKTPKFVRFVDELPRNVMGKVEKEKLRQDLAHLFASDAPAAS